MDALKVECYSGYRAEQLPRRFWLASHCIEVSQVLDQWLAPDHRYFKLRGDDGSVYILRHDTYADSWELTFFDRLPAASV